MSVSTSTPNETRTPQPADAMAAVAWERDKRRRELANPLLAVCATCGGAGASTFAYLVARSATERSEHPVLLCDAGGPTGGLATYVGVEAPRSLAGASNALRDPEPPAEGLFVEADHGLRVLAGAPDLETDADPIGLSRLLQDAQEAHFLTVADCGTLRGRPERQVLAQASHVAWMLPATASGLRRGRRVLELVGIDRDRPEVLIARVDAIERSAPVDELANLAAVRNAALVLMPRVPDLGDDRSGGALAEVKGVMEAVWTVLRR